MALLGKTKAVAFKLKNDIDKLIYIINIVVSIFFICYYGYNIYSNINNVVFLVINIIFVVLGLFGFILYLTTYKKTNTTTKKIKKIIGKTKYAFKLVVLGINAYNLIKFGGTDLALILLIISAVALIVQLIIEIAKTFISKYIDLFMLSIQQDFEFFTKIAKIKETKGNFYQLLDAPLEAIANRIEGKVEEKELTKTEQALEEILDQYGEKVEEHGKQKKKMKKQEAKERSEERARLEKQAIKDHLSVIKKKIFRQKEKVD